ncbi:MAG TPA: hypothetical protein PLQ97_10570 [Myxococcota bacterium]|nr:hypothetical protein [Myxococcota bacterium]HQK51245.1 hypothetical protein [Myxococcota bacterium]
MKRYGWVIGMASVMVACSSSLGSAGEDLPAEGVTVQVPCADPDDIRPVDRCPDLPTVPSLSAFNVVETLRPLARSIEGTGSRWTGRVSGRQVGANGRPTTLPGSGWVTAFCQGDDALWFDVTLGECRLRNLCGCRTAGTCGGAACDGASEPVLPTVDSDRAIRAAFHGDGAEGTYDLDYDSRTGRWTVTRKADGARVQVDGATGAVVP